MWFSWFPITGLYGVKTYTHTYDFVIGAIGNKDRECINFKRERHVGSMKLKFGTRTC